MSARRYWERITDKAAELGTDGCTCGTSMFRDCCIRHDLEYRLGRTLSGRWITRREADRRFLSCMQSRSVWGWWTPVGWGRYLVVRLFGRKAWKGQQ